MILGILAFGALLRTAMFLSAKSLWGDEMYSLNFASGKNPAQVILHALETNHPPLYYLLLNALTALFGGHETVYRLVSFAPGVVTVWLVYRLGRLWFNRDTAATAALLAAVSPYLLQASNEIRAYSLVSLLASLTLLLLFKAIRKNKYVPFYVVSASLLVYVEHIAVFVFIGTTLYLLWTRQKKMLGPQTAVLALHAPWAALAVFQAVFREKVFDAARVTEYWNVPWLAKKAVALLWQLVCGYQFSMLTVQDVRQALKSSPLFWAQAAVVAGAAVLMIKALKALGRRHPDVFKLFVLLFAAPIALLWVLYPIRLSARYLSFAAPIFFLVLGCGIASLRGRVPRAACLGALLALNLAADASAIHSAVDPMHRQDFRGMVEYVSRNSDAQTAIAGSLPFYNHYVKKLGLSNDPPTIEDALYVTDANTRGITRLWLIMEINMHPEVTETSLSINSEHLGRLGFMPVERKRFGGDHGLTLAMLYIRPGQRDPEDRTRVLNVLRLGKS